MVKVLKEFQHAVGGYDVKTFKPGEQNLPPDTEAYARREGLVEEMPEAQKAELAKAIPFAAEAIARGDVSIEVVMDDIAMHMPGADLDAMRSEITTKAEQLKTKQVQKKARGNSPENKAVEAAPENKQAGLE